MAVKTGESRKHDGARLRGRQETNRLLENLGLQLGVCPNKFAMYAASVGLTLIANLDPSSARKALETTKKELCDMSLTFEDVIAAEQESLLGRKTEYDSSRADLFVIHQKLRGGD